MRRRVPPLSVSLLCAFMVAILVSEAIIYRPPPLRAARTSTTLVSSRWRGSSLDARLHLSIGGVETKIRLVALPITETLTDRAIAVFDDPAYAVSGSDRRTIRGVFDNLSGELRIRGYGEVITDVGEAGLVQILRNTLDAHQNIVVITSGAFPGEVFSRQADLVTPWLSAGGILFWGGGPIGYYGLRRGQPLNPDDPTFNRRDDGPARLLGAGAVSLPATSYRLAADRTSIGEALDLQYRGTAFAVRVVSANTVPFRALGWVDGVHSSITSVPKGSGYIVDFGGEVFDELPVAHDITAIILSNVLTLAGTVAFADVNATSIGADGTVKLHLNTPASTVRVLIVAYDPEPDGVYLERIPIDRSAA